MSPRSGKLSQVAVWGFLAVILAVIAGLLLASWPVNSREGMLGDQLSDGNTQESLEVEAEFVGTERCADCHSEKASDYQTSGHSRTFHLVEELPILSQLDGQSCVDPIRQTTFHYSMDGQQLSARIPEIFGDDLFPLQYALGSGQNAYTFLTLIPGPDGKAVGVEHRISLFSESGPGRTDVPPGALGLTPGQKVHQINEEVDHFGHIVSGKALTDCVRCHTTTAEIRGGEVVNLLPNVGCESCHGPGSEHVRFMATSDDSDSLTAKSEGVRHLGGMFSKQWSAMDEIRLCGKCHRMPDDVPQDRISPYHPSTVRFQPVGLLKSRCFLESDNQLSCSVCHDPHSHSSVRKQSDYESQCLSCHQAERFDQMTSCPVSPQNNCIRCHMPAVEIFPGVHFHDHWIRIRDDIKMDETSQ